MIASADAMHGYSQIQAAIVRLLETARRALARSINAAMTATYREIGRRIVRFEQGGAERATYGDALVERLAKDLTQRFGRGFSRQNLGQMRAFYRAWPEQRICQTLSGKSSLVSILEVLSGESRGAAPGRQSLPAINELSNLAKAFPLPWSAYVRLLSEHLADFLLELGDDFAFVGRQRRLRLDDTWFRVDLLFFHRRLKCLLVIDLKAGKFSHSDAGQVLAAEYRTVLPDEKLLADELVRTRRRVSLRPQPEDAMR